MGTGRIADEAGDPNVPASTPFLRGDHHGDGSTYTEHGTFTEGTRAASKLLPGFSVDVKEALSPRP